MTNDTRFKEVIKALEDLHDENPDLRFGALIQLAVDKYTRSKNKDLHDISTKRMHSILRAQQKSLRKRKERGFDRNALEQEEEAQ